MGGHMKHVCQDVNAIRARDGNSRFMASETEAFASYLTIATRSTRVPCLVFISQIFREKLGLFAYQGLNGLTFAMSRVKRPNLGSCARVHEGIVVENRS